MTYLETQLGPQNLTMGGLGPRGPPLDPNLCILKTVADRGFSRQGVPKRFF